MDSAAATTRIKSIGDAAEAKVIAALAKLPLPWQTFNTVEWRKIGHYGEEVGEADVVVFHPAHGLVVFEIKAGEVSVVNGQWLYASGRPMKQSPFAQARRNRFALMEKLERRLGKSVLDTLTITHAVWFPDVRTQGRLQIAEAPSPAFIFDHDSLDQPEARLLKLFAEANPAPQAWSKVQQHALKELLAPDCHLLTPLSFKLDDTLDALHRATDQQIAALRVLRTQKRMLVEGGAGSGKLPCPGGIPGGTWPGAGHPGVPGLYGNDGCPAPAAADADDPGGCCAGADCGAGSVPAYQRPIGLGCRAGWRSSEYRSQPRHTGAGAGRYGAGLQRAGGGCGDSGGSQRPDAGAYIY